MWCSFVIPSVIAASTAILLLYSDGKMVLWHSEEFCSLDDDDSTLSIEHHSIIQPCAVFSDTWEQSSLKFQQAVKLAQYKFPDMELHRLSLVDEPNMENDDNSYGMDIAVLHGRAPGLVVHTAGTHGVEGYAGAAIQLTWLHFLLLDNDKASRPTMILVHAVNPYGMKHYRRANEHNVDLNRNGIPESNDQNVWESLRDRHFNKNNYDRFAASLFHLPGPPVVWYSLLRFFLQGVWAIAQYGLLHLKTAMVAGQYHAPHGIFYGGQETQVSLRRLREFLQGHTHPQQVVTWIDVHTGLGPMGVDTLLVQHAGAAAQLEQWFPGAQHPFSTDADAATQVAQGYENVQGFLSDYFEPLFEHAWVVTQEFGTIPTMLVGLALVLENAAYQFLPETEALEWAKCTTKRAFYPQSRKWRESVIRRGMAVLQQAIERSKILSEEMQQEKDEEQMQG